jgi:hypothetical protein
MSQHISYFALKKGHKTFKKGAKTLIRRHIGDFFEIRKRNGKFIRFREDKLNKELFEPIYANTNIKKLESELKTEFNDLLEFNVTKKIDKFGLTLIIYFSWTDDVHYTMQEVDVELDSKFYSTSLDKEIGSILSYELSDNVDFVESLVKKELKEGNKRIEKFISKCDKLSEEVGFDVFNNYLSGH